MVRQSLFDLCSTMEGDFNLIMPKLELLRKMIGNGSDCCLEGPSLLGLSMILGECCSKLEKIQNTELAAIYEMAKEESAKPLPRIMGKGGKDESN